MSRAEVSSTPENSQPRRHRYHAIGAIAATLLCASTAAHAGPTIDGNITDWGLHRTGNVSDWTPSATINHYTVEDQTGNSGVFLNPGYGGQRYDAEAIYLSWDATNLYVLIITGLPFNNPHNPAGNSYGAGDILIDFGQNGSFEYGMAVKGYAGLTPGSVYQVGSVNYGLWSAPGVLGHPGTNPVAIKTGTQTGTGQLAYTLVGNNMGLYAADQHYAIEAAIPILSLGAFWGNGQKFDVQWTMYCANDIISVDPLVAPRGVPEPGVPALLAAALVAGAIPAGRRFVNRKS